MYHCHDAKLHKSMVVVKYDDLVDASRVRLFVCMRNLKVPPAGAPLSRCAPGCIPIFPGCKGQAAAMLNEKGGAVVCNVRYLPGISQGVC